MNHATYSLHCVAFRVARLAPDGTTPADAGSNSAYVSDKLMKIDFNPEVDEGPEVADRGASGLLIRTFKMKDLLKRLNIEMEIGTGDFELEWLLTGGDILTSSEDPLDAMGALSSSTLTSGGQLVAATYGYKVSALSQYGETIASAEKTQVVPAGTSTNTVTLTWTTITDAVGYRVYGRTSGGPWRAITQIPQAASPTWTDLGTITPDPALSAPTADTSGVAPSGLAYPAVGFEASPPVSIEAWTRNVAQPGSPGLVAGEQVPTAPYQRWVFPRIFLTKSDRTIDGNPMASVFTGWAEENSGWGNGPWNDWLYPSNRMVQMAQDIESNVPANHVGRLAIPAQV
jgi:hypothetical protein